MRGGGLPPQQAHVGPSGGCFLPGLWFLPLVKGKHLVKRGEKPGQREERLPSGLLGAC